MPHLMNKQQHHQPDGKLPAEDQRIDRDREQCRETRPTKLGQEYYPLEVEQQQKHGLEFEQQRTDRGSDPAQTG